MIRNPLPTMLLGALKNELQEMSHFNFVKSPFRLPVLPITYHCFIIHICD